MKNQITYIVVGIAVIIGGILIFTYGSKPVLPEVAEDGTIKGNYSIEGIIALGKPYVCTFEKTDSTSKVLGIMRTDGENMYGEFRIETELMPAPFSSFLIVKNNETYTWTTLAPMGYRAPVAKSANRNASPEEQAQLIGTKDEVYYECEVWEEVDSTYFDLPDGVVFEEMKS